ncbi:MAG: hypothetical protein WBA10_02085 [Elainellaceae cyanobacterium]
MSFADRLVEVLAIIVLTLYLLLHGDEFWEGVLGWLPEDFSTSVRPAFQEQFRISGSRSSEL